MVPRSPKIRSPKIIEQPEAKPASLFVTLIFMAAGPSPAQSGRYMPLVIRISLPRSYATRATPIKQTYVWTVSTPTLAGQTEHMRLT